jgi:hypothetical protein
MWIVKLALNRPYTSIVLALLLFLVAYKKIGDRLAASRWLGGESQSQASAVPDPTRAESLPEFGDE